MPSAVARTCQSVSHELNPADERILDALAEGTRNPSWLADELDYSRQYVHQRLQGLVDADLVENLGHGLYRLDEVDGPGGLDGVDDVDPRGVPRGDGSRPYEP